MLASREGACTHDQAEAAFGKVLQRLQNLGPHILPTFEVKSSGCAAKSTDH